MKEEFQGEIGEDEFYHIEVRAQREFKRFRAQCVGENWGIERVGGQRENGVWDTVKWLVSKKLAHIEDNQLVADDQDAQKLFDQLKSNPKHIRGDFFEAKS